jgi:hypothetical protein
LGWTPKRLYCGGKKGNGSKDAIGAVVCLHGWYFMAQTISSFEIQKGSETISTHKNVAKTIKISLWRRIKP